MITRKLTVYLLGIIMAVAAMSCSSNSGDITITANSSKNFSVTTTSYNGQYAPRHVLAIWIEDSSGKFVKTLLVNAAARKSYLTSWISNSSGNVTDATTGATLNSHSTHTATWNGTNKSGTAVATGTYKLCVEYTEDNGTGKMKTTDFSYTTASAVKQASTEPAVTVNF
ncbi:MAG: hypothetical protein RIS29_777 [Bacteroidota bacterium]|jgi:hypothetical protein